MKSPEHAAPGQVPRRKPVNRNRRNIGTSPVKALKPAVERQHGPHLIEQDLRGPPPTY